MSAPEWSVTVPEGWTPLEIVYAVKCLDAQGEVVLHSNRSDGLTCWETAGILMVLSDLTRDELREGRYNADDEEATE